MARIIVAEEKQIDAPAELVYSIIRNYREHHPRILPAAFTDLCVEEGGIGAGTIISFKLRAGGVTRSYRDIVEEPVPGRVLTESDAAGGAGKVTTFTVTPADRHSRVRIETQWAARGLRGIVDRLLAPRLLRTSIRDELERLNRYAASVPR